MSAKTEIIIIVVVSLAVPYGLICGYMFSHQIKEWVATSMMWRFAAFAGLFAFISYVVAVLTYNIFSR